MLFGFEFTDDVDPTALATFILAAITLATVLVGGIALRRTRSEIDLSRREVEEAHRPVLIPIIDATQELHLWDATTKHPVRPFFREASRVVVPIKNIGSGPALDITASLTPRNDAGEFSEAWGGKKHTSNLVGLGVSELTPIMIYVPSLGDLPNFDLWLEYLDVAGKRWVTSARYLKSAAEEYSDLSITSV